MKTQNKFWWFVVVAIAAIIVVLCSIAILFWQQLSPDQKDTLIAIFKEDFAYFFTAIVLLFTAFGFGLDWFFRFYIIPVNQLAEETHLITAVNPSLQIRIEGSHDIIRLVDIINNNARQQAVFRQSVENQLQSAKAQVEGERNILATLLEDLPQGIMICNLDGFIVFYNRKIKKLLSKNIDLVKGVSNDQTQWMGLGRSVFYFIEKELITKALERIGRNIEKSGHATSERFLVDTPATCMLPGELIPVLDNLHHITGFIVIIEDQMVRLQKEKELSIHLQEWRHKLIQAVSVIKATAEILIDESIGNKDDRIKLTQIMAKESELAARLLKQGDLMIEWTARPPWPLTSMAAQEWGRQLESRASEFKELAFKLDNSQCLANISIDMHHLTMAIIYIMYRIKQEIGPVDVTANLQKMDSWVHMEMMWQGPCVDHNALDLWKLEIPRIESAVSSNSVEEILEFHGAKLWVGKQKKDSNSASIVLLLPIQDHFEKSQAETQMTILTNSRPEFYDFDLFKQAGQKPDLDKRLLRELNYTVFDSETTGLNPRAGDEIISIGAVRIVNGRLLQDEQFNQLVNPRREIPWASIKIHGIRPEMLKNQPFIENVLPRFQQYAQDTILIGHNVAFDMLMLQQKEAHTKICFDNPVLDTMLLSTIVHPAHSDHRLEAIAERMGVDIVGRHSALGDAIVTAKIFLKFLPLLAEHNIHTLIQARQASENTYYAHLKY